MKIGVYVRTKKGGIGKIIKIEPFMNNIHIFLDNEKGDIIFKTKNRVCKVCNEESIIKSSPNIIDLIEVGDYVNGKYVDKYQGKLGVFCELPNGKWDFIELTNEHYLISSIVTKEQFERMQYNLESQV